MGERFAHDEHEVGREPLAGSGRAPGAGPPQQEGFAMALDPKVKKNWEEIQKKYDHPVNAIGLPIKPTDVATLKTWKDEGIDKFIKR